MAESFSSSSDFLKFIPSLLTKEDNIMLQEFPSVVFEMDGNSAPDPDGFSGKFFTFAWEIIAMDLLAAIKSYFCAQLPIAVASTLLILILKIFLSFTLLASAISSIKLSPISHLRGLLRCFPN